MFFLNLIAAVAAAVAPSPSPTPREPPKTIITIVSSPYCNSLAQHFNGALVPMLANDRTLDAVSVQLDDLNTLFSQPDYVQRFLHVRDHMLREETELNQSLAAIQREINQLRDGARLTTDPQATAAIHDAAQDLQTAYDKQRQLSIDLQGMYQAMLTYPIYRVNPAMGGFDPAEMRMPADERNVKSYLRFDGQRDVIAQNEDKATDIALAAVEKNCVTRTPVLHRTHASLSASVKGNASEPLVAPPSRLRSRCPPPRSRHPWLRSSFGASQHHVQPPRAVTCRLCRRWPRA